MFQFSDPTVCKNHQEFRCFGNHLLKLCLHDNAKICTHSRNFLVTLCSPIGGVDFPQISEILITWNYAKRVLEIYPKYASYAV